MKKFCARCGDEILDSKKQKFCTKYCADKWRHYHKPVTIANYFPLFKNIVSASDTPEEFNELYQKYFGKGGGLYDGG